MCKFQRMLWLSILIVSISSLWVTGSTQERFPDVHYVPTPEEVVAQMLQMARVNKDDVVYDLGCGDGRIVITAAKVFGARGVGIDIDPDRIKECNENARRVGVAHKVKFLQQDLFKADIREATVVTLYLLSELNLKLRPKLFSDLRPGTRIVSHEFTMDDWKPDSIGTVRDMKLYYNPNIPMQKDVNFYYWVIPAQIAGTWRWSIPSSTGDQDYELRLTQTFQEINGSVRIAGREVAIADARLIGDQFRFAFRDDSNHKKIVLRFIGRVSGDSIEGVVEVQGSSSPYIYSWTAKRGL